MLFPFHHIVIQLLSLLLVGLTTTSTTMISTNPTTAINPIDFIILFFFELEARESIEKNIFIGVRRF